jgi:hypothetical protein
MSNRSVEKIELNPVKIKKPTILNNIGVFSDMK